MTSTLILLVLMFVLAMLWLDGARARELAIGISKAACKQQGLQLLDDTVFLERIGLRWTTGGLRFRRMFRFEYSTEGTMRQHGYIILVGPQLELIQLQDASADS